jgi:hypothetical protein
MGRKKTLQYWNSGSPFIHKALRVVAEKREGRERWRGEKGVKLFSLNVSLVAKCGNKLGARSKAPGKL